MNKKYILAWNKARNEIHGWIANEKEAYSRSAFRAKEPPPYFRSPDTVIAAPRLYLCVICAAKWATKASHASIVDENKISSQRPSGDAIRGIF